MLTVAEKYLTLKEHYSRLLNVEFPWGKVSLLVEDPLFGFQQQIDKESIKSALAKMKTRTKDLEYLLL